MKILIIGSFSVGALETYYYKALKKCKNVEISTFNTDQQTVVSNYNSLYNRVFNRIYLPLHIQRLEKKLSSLLKINKYDVAIVFKGSYFSRAYLDYLKSAQTGIIWININPDDPLNYSNQGSTNNNIIDSIDFYHLYITWSKIVAEKISNHRSGEVKVIPFGFDIDSYCQEKENKTISEKLFFYGAWDQLRESIICEIKDIYVEVYGFGWNRSSIRGKSNIKIIPYNIYGSELLEKTRNSLITLNLLRPQNYSSHNMRTFEIPSMGGLMLTTRSDEQNHYFPENVASLMFENTRELNEKIKFIKEHKEETRQIRTMGNTYARHNSYDERVELLISFIQKLL